MDEFKYKNGDRTRAIVQIHSTECSAYPDMIIKAAFVVNKINSGATRAFHLFFMWIVVENTRLLFQPIFESF